MKTLKWTEIINGNLFAGENFAVFRTMDGNARVTEAYCPHLGASFATGGVVKDECIECPFHKWKFDSSTGKCVSIPNLDNGKNLIHIHLHSFIQRSAFTYIFKQSHEV